MFSKFGKTLLLLAALLLVLQAAPFCSALASRRGRTANQQQGLEPDYASRRRIRDVEADVESGNNDILSADAGDTRFIETRSAIGNGQQQQARTLDPPVSDEEVEANAVKAKLMMQAESLGINDASDYAQSAVQQAVDAEAEPQPTGELSDAAIHRAEVELAGMFSGVISAVMSNVIREQPHLLDGSSTDRPEEL